VLAEAVRRVHALGGRVAVHVMTEAVIQAAIDAGADSIEHGTGMPGPPPTSSSTPATRAPTSRPSTTPN
jgi:hypothetical protein